LVEQKTDEAYEEVSLSVYARAENKQKESWFKIASDRANPSGLDFFNVTPGDTGIDSNDNPQNDGAAIVSFAINAAQVPVFQVARFKHETGANTFAEVRKVLVLDFRSSPPAIMAALQCVSAEGGGACGVYDNGTAPTTALVCNWDAVKGNVSSYGDCFRERRRRSKKGIKQLQLIVACCGQGANSTGRMVAS
jgi:hypothetical protein